MVVQVKVGYSHQAAILAITGPPIEQGRVCVCEEDQAAENR